MKIIVTAVVVVIWGGFLCAAKLMSGKVKKRPTEHQDRKGGWLIIAQYSAFFTILTRSYLFPAEPFSLPLQIAGVAVALTAFGTYLAMLRVFGENYSPMVRFHEGHELCDRGLFRLVRHPLYLMQMVMMVGTGMMIQHPVYLALPIPFAIMYFTARREERMLSERLEGYEEYCRRTGMFFPRVFLPRGSPPPA